MRAPRCVGFGFHEIITSQYRACHGDNKGAAAIHLAFDGLT